MERDFDPLWFLNSHFKHSRGTSHCFIDLIGETEVFVEIKEKPSSFSQTNRFIECGLAQGIQVNLSAI